MADLNALIAQGVQFKAPPDPFAQYAQMQQLQQGQQENALNRMKMDEYQRSLASQNAMRASTAPEGVNPQHWAIDPKEALAIAKEQAAAGASKAASGRSRAAMIVDQQKWENQAKRDLLFNLSPENIKAFAQDGVLHGFMTPEQAQAKVDQYLSMPPEQLRQMLSSAGASAGEMKPSLNVINQSGQNSLVQTPAFSSTPTTIGTYADMPLPANVVAQKAQIAAAGRAPAQPRPEQPPVAVVDPVTGKQVYVSREEALKGRMTPAAAMESLPPQEIQKRESVFPQATSSVKNFEAKSDIFLRDLKALRDHPGLGQITGPIFGRTGSVSKEGSAAQAAYDKVMAKGGFQSLQDMRDASKTGGALGNVSNQEGKQLQASFAAIDRRQAAEDVQAAIDQAIADLEGSKTRMREAYEQTYSYKSKTPAAAGSIHDQADAILRGK